MTQWRQFFSWQQIGQTVRRYQKFFLAAMLTSLMAINLTPGPASAFDWTDLLRVVPSVIQIVQLSNISDNDEVEFGRQINQQVLSEVRVSRDRSANDLVNSIGQQLIRNSDRPDIPYTFQVIESNDINAFATMGGFVYINTGTIAAADNYAQLASVIGHEMGHISGRHALEQMRQMAIAQGIATAIGADRDRLVQIGTEVALRLPNSREAEFDADRRGLVTISKSGFAPQAMPAFMQKLANSGGSLPSFLSSHPAATDRIVVLNELIQKNNLYGTGGLNSQDYQRSWRNRFQYRG